MAVIKLHQNRVNPLVLPVILADQLGMFKKQQVTVDLRLAETFQFNGKSEFMTGEVDAMMGDTTFFFYYLKDGKYAKITSNLTRTIQIVGNQDVTAETALQIGVNRKGLFRFFQEHFLTGQLKKAQVVWLNNTFERIQAMRDKKINGLVAIEPFITDVLIEFQGEVLWHSKDIPHYFVMWCFAGQFIDEHPQTVRNFHLALSEAAEYFNQLSPSAKVSCCRDIAGYSQDLADRMSDFVFEEQGNYQVEDFDLCQKWLFKEGEISELYEASDYLFPGI